MQRFSSGWCLRIWPHKEGMLGCCGPGVLGLWRRDHKGRFGGGGSASRPRENAGCPSRGAGHGAFQHTLSLCVHPRRGEDGPEAPAPQPTGPVRAWRAPRWGTSRAGTGRLTVRELPEETCAMARRHTETPGDGNDNVLLSPPVFFACLLKRGA